MTINKKYELSEAFIEKFAGANLAYISAEKVEQFLKKLQRETDNYYFDASSEYNIQRILDALYDRKLFIMDSLQFPHYIEILVALAASSNYLCEIILRNPEYFYFILNPANLKNRVSSEKIHKEVSAKIKKFQKFETKLNFLKSYKRRIILQIGAKDILGLSGLREVTEDLSRLANILLSELFELCYLKTQEKLSLNIRQKRYCLVSLGKLGGNELNYSSDVDLMLLYDKNSKVGREKKVDYFDLLTETCQLFVEKGTEVTDRGFLYRIDFRLRPDGKSSPLCRTFNDTIRYYESRGEEWERQMLIKLGFVGGSKTLFDDLQKYLYGYIYPASFSESPLKKVSEMKRAIEKNNPQDRNIKTGRGGIRDIEFLVQALQMLNGGKKAELRTGNTLDAINILSKNNLLGEEEKDLFEQSYNLYRRTEHFLQLLNDEQTHTMPEKGRQLENLARFIGYKSAKQFKSAVKDSRNKVNKKFISLTGSLKTEEDNFDIEQRFKNPQRAQKNLAYLSSGTGPFSQKLFDGPTIRAFNTVREKIIQQIVTSADPDKTLDNIVKIVRNYPLPSIFYQELNNRDFIKPVIKLCEYSQRAVDMMGSDKSLIDFLISRQAFVKDLSRHYDYSINKFVFTLVVQYSLGLLSAGETSAELSKFISKKVEQYFSSINFSSNFFVAGLGSFGSYEMTFASDLDLFLICEEDENYHQLQNELINLITDLNNFIYPFQTDFRLRPEGNKGPLAWGIESFSKYIKTRARLWEFQALHKINFICGDKKLFSKCKRKLSDQIKSLDNIVPQIKNLRTELLKSGISSSRGFNIKNDPGGLIDLGLILDTYVLTQNEFYKSTFGHSATSILKKINPAMDKSNSQLLTIAYKDFKNLELSHQVLFNVDTTVIGPDKFCLLAQFLNYKTPEILENEISAKLDGVKKIIDSVFK